MNRKAEGDLRVKILDACVWESYMRYYKWRSRLGQEVRTFLSHHTTNAQPELAMQMALIRLRGE